MRLRSVGVGALALACASTAARCSNAMTTEVKEELALKELWAAPIDGAVFDGSIVSGDEALVVSGSSVTRVTRRGAVVLPCEMIGDPIAAASGESHVVEVIDRGPPTRLLTADAGGCVSVQEIGLPGPPLGAWSEHGTWFLMSRAAGVFSFATEFQLTELEGSRTTSTRLTLPPEFTFSYDRDGTPLVRVRGAGAGFILAAWEHPFNWVHLGGNSSIKAIGLPEYVEGSIDRRRLAFAPVDLGRGYLQVVADLTGDTRQLHRFSDVGGPLGITELGVPFGLVDSDPEKQLLLAVRTTDVTEIVMYHWDWRRAEAGERNINP